MRHDVFVHDRIVESVVLGCARVRERTRVCVCVCVWLHDAFVCNVTHSYAAGSLLQVSSGECVCVRERTCVCLCAWVHDALLRHDSSAWDRQIEMIQPGMCVCSE